MNLLGYKIYTDYLELPIREKTIINTINPHSYCISRKDNYFAEALKNSDILLADGIGIVWATKVLKGKKIKKIAGYDIFIHLMNYLNSVHGSCFFLGASQQTLNFIKENTSKEYPNLRVGSYSPPYKAIFDKADSVEMCKRVNNFKPDVLFVGMTAPKQEKWVYEFKNNLDADIICSIGAVFDFYAGTIKRPGKVWINLGLEWLPRFLKEPKRLAKRNLVSTPKFIAEVIFFKLFKRRLL
ncbi:WecB/TagA/CpsF family glycosyltransferase [Costertonia aggregata]|uniref:WecB/TagA/CpsF family glycosyltransferase n=1 Tax=Costertonia aggregata TaxID=343403 RepID=A0A7H9AMA6_9FLAO|nr:WecB/TagA/CpsF family glycosyltransferase [Costertonia aggregata]QLG44571.1 WecB/TagA/CpsF family glycosyltransferase [Costertonia aggregata]